MQNGTIMRTERQSGPDVWDRFLFLLYIYVKTVGIILLTLFWEGSVEGTMDIHVSVTWSR